LCNSASERDFNSLISLGLRVIGGTDESEDKGSEDDEGTGGGSEGDFDRADRGFEEGATFTGLSETTGRAEDFFSGGTKAGVGAGTGLRIAFGIKAFSFCAWLNKEST
jgi:hypothetical protein